MSVLAPPPQDELKLLIREARARQRRRWIGLVALLAVIAGAGLGTYAIAARHAHATASTGGPAAGGKSGGSCGVRVAWTKILDRSGNVLYREPVKRTMGHQLQCSGASIWVVFYNGVGMSQQAYFGVRSGDGGRTWKPVFTERYFGLKAPHMLGAYLGPWTLRGPRDAYFAGFCSACGSRAVYGTVSLWVTKDGGRTFRRYSVPALEGFEPTRIRVAGHAVTISAKRFSRGVAPHKTATISVA